MQADQFLLMLPEILKEYYSDTTKFNPEAIQQFWKYREGETSYLFPYEEINYPNTPETTII